MSQQILDIAEELVQVRGFNGFSYADVASRLHVTKASLHYHFGTKEQLGTALIARYSQRFFGELDRIGGSGLESPAKLAAYAQLYADVLADNRLCLCGMLAAEYATLPEVMRAEVLAFFDTNEAWLEAVLVEGQKAAAVKLTGSAKDAARAILGGLEGAMLVSRPYGGLDRFRAAADSIVAGILHPAE